MKQFEGFGVLERPSFFGRKRDEIIKNYDSTYGKDNWQLGWLIGRGLKWIAESKSVEGKYIIFDYPRVCKLYEDAYFKHFEQHPDELDFIVRNASEVYDNSQSNVESGLNYEKQEQGIGTHIQDIAIRNIVARIGRQFEGKNLLQTRSNDRVGKKWSPMMIEFHHPEWIMQPKLGGWWNRGVEDSVECFYQSNKVLLVKK